MLLGSKDRGTICATSVAKSSETGTIAPKIMHQQRVSETIARSAILHDPIVKELAQHLGHAGTRNRHFLQKIPRMRRHTESLGILGNGSHKAHFCLRIPGKPCLKRVSLLELVGRGVERSSEMASRMNVQQTSLSKPLAALINTSFLQREIPFGETIRSTKRVIYRIQDPCLRFWYGVYSPPRTRWHRYSSDKKKTLIREHASQIFEHELRKLFPDAQRYRERDIEIDAVRYADQGGKNLVLFELKFKKIPKKNDLASPMNWWKSLKSVSLQRAFRQCLKSWT
jgi:hypothetical protein